MQGAATTHPSWDSEERQRRRRGRIGRLATGGIPAHALSAGLTAFTSWQRIGLLVEGPDAGSQWACHCEKYRDEDDNFVGLACDVGRAEAPAYQIEVDGNAGWLTGADGTLEVSMQRALIYYSRESSRGAGIPRRA